MHALMFLFVAGSSFTLAGCSKPACYDPCVKFHLCRDPNQTLKGAEAICDPRTGDNCGRWTPECIDCVNGNSCGCPDGGNSPSCKDQMPACAQCFDYG